MSDMTLHERLQALHKEENETLVRDLEIEMLEPETRQARSGKDITYLNWQYRNLGQPGSDWKTRNTPIFTEEAKVLLAQGPYESGKQYRVTAKKDENDYWRWQKIEGNTLSQQREARMQSYTQEALEPTQQVQQSQAVSQSHEPQP